MLSTLAAASLAIVTGSCGRSSAASHITAIVSAAEERQRSLCDEVHVEWKTDERVLAERLRLSAIHQFTVSVEHWRLDRDGTGLLNGRACPMRRVLVGIDGMVKQYVQANGHTRGQIYLQNEPCPFANDAALLPIFMFARPSDTLRFRYIKEGQYCEVDDQESGQGIVCLERKRTATRLWFDVENGYVLTRSSSPRRECVVKYAIFPAIGLAPSKFTSVILPEKDGDPPRRLIATFTRWHKEREEIANRIDFTFPQGTKVVDLTSARVD